MTTSVLMSTYAAEKASNLREALESLYNQTMPPEQLVLVLDGPVGRDQEAVIADFEGDCRIGELVADRLRLGRSEDSSVRGDGTEAGLGIENGERVAALLRF